MFIKSKNKYIHDKVMDLTQYIILGGVLEPKLTCESHSYKDQVTP